MRTKVFNRASFATELGVKYYFISCSFDLLKSDLMLWEVCCVASKVPSSTLFSSYSLSKPLVVILLRQIARLRCRFVNKCKLCYDGIPSMSITKRQQKDGGRIQTVMRKVTQNAQLRPRRRFVRFEIVLSEKVEQGQTR
jgi:hypothetical protein